jgi:D-alanyl-D-alanine carboxypeptidase
MRNLNNTPYGQFIWWIGVVEDTFGDPSELGRVRVRIYGFHPTSKVLTTEELPLAPVLNGGVAKINPGEMVLGFFMDGTDAQQPFILGVIGGATQSIAGRFFGALGDLVAGLPLPANTPDAVTAHIPNPVPGSCPVNLEGKIKDANGTLDPNTLVRIGTQKDGRPALLKKEAAESYLAMVAAAKANGITWVINDSYRTYQQQIDIRRSVGVSLSATPGKSNHGCGLAVDLGVAIYERPPYHWLMKNAAKFGFKRIYLSGRGAQPESWHWEYTLRSSKSPTDGQAKHVPETTPDGQKNIYDEQVKKAPTVIGKPKP